MWATIGTPIKLALAAVVAPRGTVGAAVTGAPISIALAAVAATSRVIGVSAGKHLPADAPGSEADRQKQRYRAAFGRKKSKYKPCGDATKATHFPGKCGDFAYEGIRKADVPGLPKSCKDDKHSTCQFNGHYICLCEDGLYSGISNVTYTGKARGKRDGSGRHLAFNEYIDYWVDNQYGEDRGYIVQVIPTSPNTWRSDPWIDEISFDLEAENDNPVNRGYQVAMNVDGNKQGEWWSHNRIKSANNIQVDFKLMLMYSNWRSPGDVISLTILARSGLDLKLNNPVSICDALVPSLGFGINLEDAASVDFSLAGDPCSNNYISCGSPATYTGHYGYQGIACSATLYHQRGYQNRYLRTGIQLKP